MTKAPILALAAAALLSGCAVYGPPPAVGVSAGVYVPPPVAAPYGPPPWSVGIGVYVPPPRPAYVYPRPYGYYGGAPGYYRPYGHYRPYRW
jgi:hypothetical protein